MTNTCVRCGRPTPDGYACADETRKAAEQLRQICDMVPAARDVAHGLSRRGGNGNASGKPGSQIPIDLTAMAKLDSVENGLIGWARHVAEERGLDLDLFRPIGDQLEWVARWLVGSLEWYRHRPECEEFLTDADKATRIVRSIASGPAPQKYLGPCGAVQRCEGLEPDDWPEGDCGDHTPHARHDREPCDGDIYAREGAEKGRCRACGAQVATSERRAWLDEIRREWLYHASEIEEAYPSIKAATVRKWYERGLIAAHGEHQKRPLYKLGEVLDLAAGDAARREEARASRARRKETAA